MANINQLVPLIFRWEGGFVNDPSDLGGPTNKGVTLATWQRLGFDKNKDGRVDVRDLILITRKDVVDFVLRPFWDSWQGDRIENQSLANLLVDWVWSSGKYGIVIPQGVLKVEQDGIVGEKTLAALNRHPHAKLLFDAIKQARINYIHSICRSRPENNRFKRGWLNRLDDFSFYP